MQIRSMFGRVGIVLAFSVAGLATGLTAPASACACGGVVSSDPRLAVDDETSLVRWHDGQETVVMQLSLQSDTDNAALVVPTPKPATVSAGSAATFAELRELTAPRVETTLRWWDSGNVGGNDEGATAAAAPGGAPNVLQVVQLGPLEATTLAGGDLPGLEGWLAGHGYTMRPEVISSLAPYVAEGWAFVAMRLTSTEPLNGGLDPVTLTFPSDRFVYPMRMSAAAVSPQQVRIYALADHRLERSDPDADEQNTNVNFAGRIFDVTSPELATLVGDGAYLTEMSTYISDPEQITSDFVFTQASNDDDYQQVRYVTEDVRIFGFMGGPFILAVALFVLIDAAVLIWVIRRSRRGF